MLARIPSPHQDSVDIHTVLRRILQCLISLDLVVDQLTVAVVRIDGHQNVATGVDDPLATSLAAEPTKNLGVDHAEPGASKHCHRQLRNHRQVERYSVTSLEVANVSKQCGKLVDPGVQVLVR